MYEKFNQSTLEYNIHKNIHSIKMMADELVTLDKLYKNQ